MKMMARAATLLLLCAPGLALAAAADNTNSAYKATPAGAINGGMVILQSSDGATSGPINSSHPLPVSATVTPSGTQDTNTKQVNGVTTSTGAGAAGTGSQRVTVAQDTATVAGSAPGIAGTPSANVVSVQGVSGGSSLSVTEAPSSASTGGVALISTAAAASNLVAKASAGNLYGFSVTNGATAGYVMVFNATSAPADGAVTPALCYSMPATTSSMGAAFTPIPAYFATGVTIVYSSTGCFTKTASATAFVAAQVQ